MLPWAIFLLLLLTGISRASVTAAWKISIEQLAPGHEISSDVRKLERPPGESAFFQPGDELWDLSRVMDIRLGRGAEIFDPGVISPSGEKMVNWTGDWAVWNARSGMAIVRGSWNDIYLGEKVFGVEARATILRTSFELLNGEGVKIRSISIVSRSGEKAAADIGGMSAEVHVTAARKGVYWFQFGLSWPTGHEDGRWEVDSAINWLEGKKVRIARHGQGKDAWELFGVVSREFPDGTPVENSRWIENEKGIEAMQHLDSYDKTVKVGDELRLRWYPVTADFLKRMGGEEKTSLTKDIEAPASLREWVRGGGFKDALSLLLQNGVEMGMPGSFAGYDPRTSLLVIVAGEMDQDLCEQITFSEGCFMSRPVMIESNLESGNWALACESGTKGRIARTLNGNEDLALKVEPSWGQSVLELRYTLDAGEGAGEKRSFESSTALNPGIPQKIGSYSLPGHETIDVTITAGDPQ